jgi:hypothetical protein
MNGPRKADTGGDKEHPAEETPKPEPGQPERIPIVWPDPPDKVTKWERITPDDNDIVRIIPRNDGFGGIL